MLIFLTQKFIFALKNDSHSSLFKEEVIGKGEGMIIWKEFSCADLLY